MTTEQHLSPEDLAAFEAWTEKFWMFIEDKGDALHIWKGATAHVAERSATLAEEVDPAAADVIRAAYKLR